jgi:hypothetical protein
MGFHGICSNICKFIPFSTFFGELFATLTTAGHGLKTLKTTRIDDFFSPILSILYANLDERSY